MRSKTTTKERKIDFKDMDELEVRVLYSMVNWSDDKVEEILQNNVGVWEDYAQNVDVALDTAIETRDEIMETALP